MRNYDFAKAKEIVEKNKANLVRASLGMAEDWWWTAQEVFPREFDFENTKTIGGISGSSWATPSIRLEYQDGNERMLPCHDDGKITGKPHALAGALGCLSLPAQAQVPPLEEE